MQYVELRPWTVEQLLLSYLSFYDLSFEVVRPS